MSTNPVLVEVTRSGMVESRHRGSFIAVDDTGSVTLSGGEVDTPMFPRSTLKPFQTLAMLESGLRLSPRLLALATASHSAEDFHLDGVQEILSDAGLSRDDLRCPPDWPLEDWVTKATAGRGEGPSRIRMNCSGKHAAMLATCVLNDWPIESYLSPEHPLQRRIREVIEQRAEERISVSSVDGCGAPLFAISLTGLARAFRSLTSPDAQALAEAFRACPEWTCGTRREEYQLMRAVPGMILKCGAEAVDAFVLPDGRAGAVKIDDGSTRGRTPATIRLLEQLGVIPRDVDRLRQPEVLGGGRAIGVIRAVVELGANSMENASSTG